MSCLHWNFLYVPSFITDIKFFPPSYPLLSTVSSRLLPGQFRHIVYSMKDIPVITCRRRAVSHNNKRRYSSRYDVSQSYRRTQTIMATRKSTRYAGDKIFHLHQMPSIPKKNEVLDPEDEYYGEISFYMHEMEVRHSLLLLGAAIFTIS